MTRYEASDHELNGKKSPLVDYDGPFYPNALNEFVSSIGYNYRFDTGKTLLPCGIVSAIDGSSSSSLDTTRGYIYGASFAEALNGIVLADKYSQQHVNWNPWYSHLNLDED